MAALVLVRSSTNACLLRQIGMLHCTKEMFSTTKDMNAAPKAAAKAKVMAQMTERKRMVVESDPRKLVTFVCGANIKKEGQDPLIKPDSDYPEWLWTLRTDRGHPPLEELDENSHQYWRVLKRKERSKVSLMKKTRHRFQIFGNKKIG